MKKLYFLIAFLLMWGISNAYAEAPAKYRVAVTDLVINDLIPAKQAEIIKNSSLIADIENAIRNGRKFELLTRREAALDAIRKEQQFATSEFAAGDAATSGNISNAQSLVQVEVLQFSFGRSSSKVPNLPNKYKISDYCSIELSVQIINTETGVVSGSFPIKASTSTGQSVSNGVGAASHSILDKTLEKAAGALANNLADTIFPIMVVAVKNQDIWINRGNDSGMKQGEIFEVFEPGEELIDPATGENLGSTETLIGTVKVVRINPKATIVHMVKGEYSAISAGYILRRPVK